MDGRDRMHATAARESERGTLHRIRAGRVTAADQRVLEQLRQVGRELLDELVPQPMLDILRAGENQQD